MITFQTDENNDFAIGPDGGLVLTRGRDAVAQEAKHFAATLRAEMIHAYDLGVPFLREVFGGQPRLAQIETALRRRLLEIDEVTGIASLEASIEDETLKYSAVLETVHGAVSVNG